MKEDRRHGYDLNQLGSSVDIEGPVSVVAPAATAVIAGGLGVAVAGGMTAALMALRGRRQQRQAALEAAQAEQAQTAHFSHQVDLTALQRMPPSLGEAIRQRREVKAMEPTIEPVARRPRSPFEFPKLRPPGF